jgi:hypothetical protein
MSPAETIEIRSLATRVQPELLRVLAALPQRRQEEVLDYARFLEQLSVSERGAAQESTVKLRPVPATTLLRLTGIVALGGDALEDSEALYDDAGGD